MNYAKPARSLTPGSLEPLPYRKRKGAIPYSAIAPIAMTCDAIIVALMSFTAGIGYSLYLYGNTGNFLQFEALAAILAALFITLGKSNGHYRPSELLSLKSQIPGITIRWIGIFLFLAGVAFTTKVGTSFSRGATIAFAVAGLAGLIGTRVFWRIFLADGWVIRQLSGRRVVLVTEQAPPTESGLVTTIAVEALQLAHHFVLPVDPDDEGGREDVIGQVISSVRGSDIDEVVVAVNFDHWPELNELLSTLRVLPCPVTLVPLGPISQLFRLPIRMIGGSAIIELQHGPLTSFERSLKRFIDIVISGTAIILLLPLLLMTAIAIKLDSPGPVIFRQRRRGFNGRTFHILKFRTMSVQEDGERIEYAKYNDTRVTRIGSWLRRTSIDELPQLFNVLQGDMSIVGPRPHALAHDNQFDKLIGKYAYRHHVKPGITGWAQVNGHRGSMTTLTDVEQRIKLRSLVYR